MSILNEYVLRVDPPQPKVIVWVIFSFSCFESKLDVITRLCYFDGEDGFSLPRPPLMPSFTLESPEKVPLILAHFFPLLPLGEPEKT